MGKYCGRIGYAQTVEKNPGVWVEDIIERTYFGDITKNSRRMSSDSHINSNVTTNNVISIVADPYAYEHIFDMRYVTWMKQKWLIINVDVQRPRLILTLGGVYNEETSRSSHDSSLYLRNS